MPTIHIDDQAYEVPAGDNVLQACLSVGLDLPYFCWHPAMGSVGACRQCALVQYRDAEDTRGRIVMGCMTPVTEGARFSMQGGTAGEFRENIIESLMLNHPHDCPVCAEGGECHLQDMTVMVGHRNRRYRGRKNTHRNQYLGPLIHHEMNRCISCYRCTRYYNDYAGGTDLSAQGAHDHVYFGRQQDGILESEFAGNLVEVCPTGVFTDKPLVNDYTRKWDLQSAPSVCIGCALGCNIMPGERYGKLKRIHNRFNSEVNGYFLCDRGRYGSSFVNDEQRAMYAGLRNTDGSYDAIESKHAIEKLKAWCKPGKKLAAIGSPRASVESNYLLRRLVGERNYCSGIADLEMDLIKQSIDLLVNGNVVTPSMKQVERSDAILILGEDVTNTAPRLALALRQSVRNRSLEIADEMNIPPWQDEAVRVLAQDQLSPLYIIAVSDTPLDDVAQHTLTLSCEDIARLGFAIAQEIDSSIPLLEGLDENTRQMARQIAASLKGAAHPLVVSGTGCQSAAVIQAASVIANALHNTNAMLSYCLPESNSLGCALLLNSHESTLDELSQRAKTGDIDTLVVMENDLYRRAPSDQVDLLLETVPNLIVLDAIDTPTMSRSALALPATTFAESEGTLISSEARAQRHYPVFIAAGQRQASWQWLKQLGQALDRPGFKEFEHFDDVIAACASEIPALSNITKASPSADFRNNGLKIPRQPHRYSGRTAMLADVALHEPKQPVDQDTPLSFSMEGVNGSQPGALLPFVWSPGWNSNQSLHKFQSEVGGSLIGGTAGVRLIEPRDKRNHTTQCCIPDAFQIENNIWRAVPIYRIFGSEELSAHSAAIKELISQPFVQLRPEDAAKLNVHDGDDLLLSFADEEFTANVDINPAIPGGCVGYAVGLPGSRWLPANARLRLSKAESKLKSQPGGA